MNLSDNIAETAAARESRIVSRILEAADFCGWQDDGNGGRFQLWTLRKALGRHPRGSTVARATMERLLFLGAPAPWRPKNYGTINVIARSPDFAAVEPGKAAR